MELIIFVLGLVIGSFLNVLIYRLPRKIGFVRGRSFCPNCKKKISWFDNVPVLSFLILKGHCRFCKQKISLRYPLVEILTGGVFALSYLSNLSLLSNILFAGLIVIFFIDLEHQIIPDEITVPLVIIFSLNCIVQVIAGLQTTDYCLLQFLTAFLSFLFFYLIFLATKGKGMGFGDVKFAFLMGLVLGWPKIIVALYIAFLTGAFIGVILILKGKAKLKQKIAFGPFLALSTVLSVIWGEKIISFLVSRLLN